jgi:hypothetical protein
MDVGLEKSAQGSGSLEARALDIRPDPVISLPDPAGEFRWFHGHSGRVPFYLLMIL